MGRLEDRVVEEYVQREETVHSVFAREAERIAGASHEMATRLHHGGRILAFGVGAAATDAQHISVEFVHPVIVGKRALPAIALPNDAPPLLAFAARDPASLFSQQLSTLSRPVDIAVGISLATDDPGAPAVAAALKDAKAAGLLTLGLTGPGETLAGAEPDWLFRCAHPDPFIVQEVHETLYHVLWETVHVFFEHERLLGDAQPSPRTAVGASSFLYPMLERGESDLRDVLRHVSESVTHKARDVCTIRRQQAHRPGPLVAAVHALAHRIDAGAKILAFGNGGSATDAQDFVCDLLCPPQNLRPVAGISLTSEEGVLTAVGNDVGFDKVFLRQIIAYGQPGDVACGISTSGSSANVLAAFEQARRQGLLTLGLVGYGGGETATRGLADHILTVDFDYIPRIQEAQASQYHVVRRLLGEV